MKEYSNWPDYSDGRELKAMVKKSDAKSTTTKSEENIASSPSEVHQSKT